METYGTAQFKLQERTRVQVHAHDTGIQIFATCLCAHRRLMTHELPVKTSRTHTRAIAHAWHEYKNIRYVLSCAQMIDDVLTYELPTYVELKQL